MHKRLYLQTRYNLIHMVQFILQFGCRQNLRLTEARTIFGCSFNCDGWHHITRTLKEFDENPDILVNKTTLWRFLKFFKPSGISSFVKVMDNEQLPLFLYPWGTFGTGESFTLKSAENSRFCGPSSDEFITNEFNQIINLYENLRQFGYNPTKYPKETLNK